MASVDGAAAAAHPRRLVCAADWRAESVETMLRTNPKALLAVSAFPGLTQYELPFVVKKDGDEYLACIQRQEGEAEVFQGRAKTKKLAELAAAETACQELNKRGLLHDPSLFLGWGVNPKQTLMNSGLYTGKSLPVTFTVSGPGHAKVYAAELVLPLEDEPYAVVGRASNKSEAEKMCCILACKKLFEDSLLVKQPAATNRAAHIHQQNEVPTIIEVQSDFQARLESALLRVKQEVDTEPLVHSSQRTLSDPVLPFKGPDKKVVADVIMEQNRKLAGLAAERALDRLKRTECRQRLPIWSDKVKILQAVENNRVIVLTGDTGSGKSTQVPQFILEEAELKGCGAEVNIVVTQPRRIAAMSLAERVAWERGETLGTSVGYSIRLDCVAPRMHGSVLFCTAGILLWRLQANELVDLSHIIIDEAHERDIATDCLLTVVRDLLVSHPTLRVIIMSATLDASIFTSYFNDCPHISIPGKSYPVVVYYREDVERLMVQSQVQPNFAADENESDVDCEFAASVILWICNTFAKDYGAILCFLPGWATIVALKERLIKNGAMDNMVIVPFHSQLSTTEQRLAFSHVEEGKRKVVLSTNIAETSVTIDDVVYVVDSGKMKVKQFKPSRNMATLKMQWTSQACALQRQGRAGRVQAGYCFRLYTKNTYVKMPEHQRPEMQRLPLEELCLQIKALIVPHQIQAAMKYQDISTFLLKTIEPPSGSAILAGVNMLKRLGAIDDQENLTSLGRILAKLAVDPRYGKAIVWGTLLGCEDVLTVAAAACFKDPFDYPVDRKDEVNAVKARFGSGRAFASDQMAMVELFDGFVEAELVGEGLAFCEKNFLNPVILKLIKGMRRQLQDTLQNHNLLTTITGSKALTRCLLVCGLSPNIARTAMCKDSKGSKRISHRWRMGFCVQAGRVLCHPLSVVDEKTMDPLKHYYMVFEEKVRSTQAFVRGCNVVPPLALVIFSGIVKERRELASKPGWTVLQVESWLELHVEAKAGELLLQIHDTVECIMRRWIDWKVYHESEKELMQVVSELLDYQLSKMLKQS